MSVDQTIARVTAYEGLIAVLQANLATELTAILSVLDVDNALTLPAPAADGYYVVKSEAVASKLNVPHKTSCVIYPTASRVSDVRPTGNATNHTSRTRLPIAVLGVLRTEAGDDVFNRPWKDRLETKERNLYIQEIFNAAIVQTIETYATTQTGILEAILIDDHPDVDFTRADNPLVSWTRSRWLIRQKIIKPNPR